jgi:uncharacterized protein YggE
VTQLIKILLLVALVSAPGIVHAQPPDTPDEPTVSTTGEAVVEAAPDRAWITITAESRAGNPREAQKRNADAMNPVLEQLKAAGIPAQAIRTVGYDLQQEWDYVNNRRVSRGFVARNTVDVRVDDIARVGELLEVAVGSGATSVGGIRFDIKDRGKLEREAIRMAVSDARARAEAAAAGAGMSIARIIRIDSHAIGGPPPPRPVMMMREQAASAADAPPIESGTMQIRAQVTLTAELK